MQSLTEQNTSLIVKSVALPGMWTRIGWIPPDNLGYKTWEDVGAALVELNKAQHFWIGDWINAGEERWGEMYAQAMDDTQFSYSTVSTDAWVCRRVPFCRRRQNLSFNHHAKVAPLRFSSDDQERLLDEAESNDWTIRKLEEAANKLRPILPELGQPPLIDNTKSAAEQIIDEAPQTDPERDEPLAVVPSAEKGAWCECPKCGWRFPWRIGLND